MLCGFLSATSALALLASAKLPMDLGMKVGECGRKATASYAEPEVLFWEVCWRLVRSPRTPFVDSFSVAEIRELREFALAYGLQGYDESLYM
jgi:hypothetical protein